MNKSKYWEDRAPTYDNMDWVRNNDWLSALAEFSNLKETDDVLDLGTGTGVVAKKISPLVKSVLAVDICEEMLSKAAFKPNISYKVLDIEKDYVIDRSFDKIISRMCFHHIKDLKLAMYHCKKMLKPGGSLIITESIPPDDSDPKVVNWWGEMFSLKEDRRVFITIDLVRLFIESGFKNVDYWYYLDTEFDIINWITNQGLDEDIQNKIIEMHRNAPKCVKEAHRMRLGNDSIKVDSKSIIIRGVT